jgi:hypothetical protein
VNLAGTEFSLDLERSTSRARLFAAENVEVVKDHCGD